MNEVNYTMPEGYKYHPFPHLDIIFSALSSGKYISSSSSDPNVLKMFTVLEDYEENFSHLFMNLGYKLIRHPKSFYYFERCAEDSVKSNKIQLKKEAAFIAVLIEANPDKGNVEDWLASGLERFSIETIPHLTNALYKSKMSAVSLESLKKLIKSMESSGLVTIFDDGTFSFLPTVSRFTDAFTRAGMVRKEHEAKNNEDNEGAEL